MGAKVCLGRERRIYECVIGGRGKIMHGLEGCILEGWTEKDGWVHEGQRESRKWVGCRDM